MNHRFCLVIAAVLVTGCGSTDPGTGLLSVPHDVKITQAASSQGPNAFSPANLSINLASQTTVTWWNRDFSGPAGAYGGTGVTHRLVSDDGITFTSGNISGNATFAATLSAPGIYAYHCSIHPAMTGTVTVNP